MLDLLQKIFYTSDAARESFVELCEEEYVQKVSWPLRGVERMQSLCLFSYFFSKCRERLSLTILYIYMQRNIMLDVPKFHKLFRFYKLTRIYLPIMYSLNHPIASWTPSTPSLEVTFDSYLYKTVQGNDPVGDLKLGWKTLSSLYKYNNQTLGLALGSILENLTFDRTILTCLS